MCIVLRRNACYTPLSAAPSWTALDMADLYRVYYRPPVEQASSCTKRFLLFKRVAYFVDPSLSVRPVVVALVCTGTMRIELLVTL